MKDAISANTGTVNLFKAWILSTCKEVLGSGQHNKLLLKKSLFGKDNNSTEEENHQVQYNRRCKVLGKDQRRAVCQEHRTRYTKVNPKAPQAQRHENPKASKAPLPGTTVVSHRLQTSQNSKSSIFSKTHHKVTV